MRSAHTAIVHQREALSLRVLDVERQAAVALGDLADTDAALAQVLDPPLERIVPGDAPRDI